MIDGWKSTIIPWMDVQKIHIVEKTRFSRAQFVICYADRGPVVLNEIKTSPADEVSFIWMLKQFAPQLMDEFKMAT